MAFSDILADLGHASYAEYLNSALWKEIRQRVYDSKGRNCIKCKLAPATEIHHRSYDALTMHGTSLNKLIPVCRDCHQAIHDGQAAEKKPKKAKAKKKAKGGGFTKKRKKPKRERVVQMAPRCELCGGPLNRARLKEGNHKCRLHDPPVFKVKEQSRRVKGRLLTEAALAKSKAVPRCDDRPPLWAFRMEREG